MPTQATIAITPGAGQLLDAVSLVIGPNTVVRETMVIADPSNASRLAIVSAAGALTVTDPILDGCITANVLAVNFPTPQHVIVDSGGGGGSVTQGTSPWVTADTILDACVSGNIVAVHDANPATQAVTGTFWQTTQPVSEAALDGCITANKVAVTDATAEGFLSTLAGTVSGGAVTVTGTVAASNPSVGTDGSAGPASSTQIGSQDGTGKLQAASSTNPIPVAIVGSGASIGAIDFAQDTARFAVAQVSITASGTVIAGVGGKIIRVYRAILVVGGTTPGFVEFDDTTPTVLFPASPFLPYSALTFDLDAEPYFTTATSAGFVITLTGISAVTGVIYYTQT